MDYSIHFKEPTTYSLDGHVIVHLNSIPVLRVPPHVMAGVGDKKKKYREFLGRCFNTNNPLLQALGQIHLLGYRKGDIYLIDHPKQRGYHAIAIKEFLEENDDFLHSILPYLFPMENVPRKKFIPAEPGSEEPKILQPSNSGESVQLSQEDIRQIGELMAKDGINPEVLTQALKEQQ